MRRLTQTLALSSLSLSDNVATEVSGRELAQIYTQLTSQS